MPVAQNYYKNIVNDLFGSLIGKTVVRVRPFVPSEFTMMAWSPNTNKVAVVVEFDDGTLLIPVSDEEYNSAGWLYIDEP